jgi:hypothetical protein
MIDHATPSRSESGTPPIGRVMALVVGTLLAAVAMFSSLAPEPVSEAGPAASSEPVPASRPHPRPMPPIPSLAAVEPAVATGSADAPRVEGRIPDARPEPPARSEPSAPAALPRIDARSSLSALPGTPLPVAAGALAIGSTGTTPALPARPVEEAPETIIRGVLDAYETSYDQLDAAATSAVWLGADTRGLARAFGTLSSQDLTFDACDITVTGSRAVASCRGSVTFTRRVGGAQPQSRRLSWIFDLEHRDRWMITRVSSR